MPKFTQFFLKCGGLFVKNPDAFFNVTFVGAFLVFGKETAGFDVFIVCPSVRPHGTTRLELDGFCAGVCYWNLVEEVLICFWNRTKIVGHFASLNLTLRRLMSYIYIYIYIYIYGAPILDVSRSHTTTQHSR